MAEERMAVIDDGPALPRKRKLSAAGRERISAAQKARWSKKNGIGLPGQALTEIDSRLAQAIRDRSEALTKVAALLYWQTRLSQIEREINSLIGYQRELVGGPSSLPTVTNSPISSIPYSHTADIPPGVGSIPSKQPAPSSGNAVDMIANEGGFS